MCTKVVICLGVLCVFTSQVWITDAVSLFHGVVRNFESQIPGPVFEQLTGFANSIEELPNGTFKSSLLTHLFDTLEQFVKTRGVAIIDEFGRMVALGNANNIVENSLAQFLSASNNDNANQSVTAVRNLIKNLPDGTFKNHLSFLFYSVIQTMNYLPNKEVLIGTIQLLGTISIYDDRGSPANRTSISRLLRFYNTFDDNIQQQLRATDEKIRGINDVLIQNSLFDHLKIDVLLAAMQEGTDALLQNLDKAATRAIKIKEILDAAGPSN